MQLTDAQWAEARALYEEGLTATDVARRMGVYYRTVTSRARREGWHAPDRKARLDRRTASLEALTVVARRALVHRLYKAIDTKLKLMERRMEKQMENMDKDNAPTSADHERDTRAFGTFIKTIAQVKEMQADLDRVAGGQPRTAADAELFAEADRFRREIAERLARFVPAAG